MRVGLIGFGKTGKAVASVIINNKNFSLEWVLRRRLDTKNRTAKELLDISSDDPSRVFSEKNTSVESIFKEYPVDCVIDFSSAKGLYDYGQLAADQGINIISAVSHYGKAELDLLKKLSKLTAVFWSPNITFGVNFLLLASKFLKKLAPAVEIQIVEEHFGKKQGISGTALKIAKSLGLKRSDISSVRAGGIVGKHEVIFGFPYQTVRITHEAISRKAFGNGALFAAEKLSGKPNGLYNFEDLMPETP